MSHKPGIFSGRQPQGMPGFFEHRREKRLRRRKNSLSAEPYTGSVPAYHISGTGNDITAEFKGLQVGSLDLLGQEDLQGLFKGLHAEGQKI